MSNWLTNWETKLSDCLTYLLSNWLIDWLISWLICFANHFAWLTEQLSYWLTVYLKGEYYHLPSMPCAYYGVIFLVCEMETWILSKVLRIGYSGKVGLSVILHFSLGVDLELRQKSTWLYFIHYKEPNWLVLTHKCGVFFFFMMRDNLPLCAKCIW